MFSRIEGFFSSDLNAKQHESHDMLWQPSIIAAKNELWLDTVTSKKWKRKHPEFVNILYQFKKQGISLIDEIIEESK